MSRVTAIISTLWLSASSSACHGLLIITDDNAITYKAQRDKNAKENWSWRTRQLLTCRCVSVMFAALNLKYEELADAKAENDALRDDVAAGRRRLHIKAVCQSVRKPPPPPAWIMQPPPTGRHRWTGLFHPQREADHYAKTTGRNPSILMSSADRVAHIDGQLMQLLSNTRASSGSIMPKVIKPSNPFTNVCWVSVLTTFSAPQILAASTVFFCPIPETKKWWVMVSALVLLLPVCFEQ